MLKLATTCSSTVLASFILQFCSNRFAAAAVTNNNSDYRMISKRQFGTNGNGSLGTFYIIIPLIFLIYVGYRIIATRRNRNDPQIQVIDLQYRNENGVFVNTPGVSVTDPNGRNKKVHLTREELSLYPITTLAEAIGDTKMLSQTNQQEQTPTFTSVPPPQLDKTKSATFDSTNSENPNFECSFCLQTILATEQVRRIPCFHMFHLKCLDSWLSEFSTSCPTCRFNLARNQSEQS